MPAANSPYAVYLKGTLLDRLKAPESSELLSGGRSAGREGLREDLYQDTVLRDLQWLFNAASPLGLSEAAFRRKYPRVAVSVLSYGLRGVLGRVVENPREIRDQVEEALTAFEPRLEIEDLSLKLTREGQLMEIEIKGILRTEEARRRLWIRTDLQTLDSRLSKDG